MSGALQAVFQNQRSFGAPPGQQAYTTPGTYSWVAPTGVTKVSVVAIGGGEIGKLETIGIDREIVLLSTASPSYSLWKNFEEKGDLFRKYVKILGK